MHQRQRQRRIGAGQQLQVFMAFVGGLALARIDADQLGAIALGLHRIAPKMQVAANAVAAPNQDQPAFGKKLHPHAQLAAIGVQQSLRPGTGANGAVQQGGAQLVEKAPVHALALHQAHGAGIAVGQDGLRVGLGDAVQPGADIGQRIVPAHRLKLAAALGPHPLHRLQHPVGMVAALGVFADLGAKHAAGVRMQGVAADLGGYAIDHRGDQRAGVGAVMGAGPQNGGGGSGGGHGNGGRGVGRQFGGKCCAAHGSARWQGLASPAARSPARLRSQGLFPRLLRVSMPCFAAP